MTQELTGNRRTRIVGLCVAGLISLVVAIYEVELMRGRGAWRDYEREAIGRGVKLKFSEYIPPQIPDAENFASTPIFDGIFKASDSGQDPVNPFTFVQQFSEPKLGNLWSQRPTDLTVWQQFLVEQKVLPKAGDNVAADILLALQRFDPLLLELREAGKRPYSRFPVHWEKAGSAPLPHLGVLERAADRYALRLSAHLALGDSTAAYQDFHDGLCMATTIREDPSFISGVTRLSIGSKMLNCVWEGLGRRQWAVPELQKIEADLATLDWLGDYVFTMNCDRGSNNDLTDEIIRDPAKISRFFGSEGSPLSSHVTRWDLIYPMGWIYQSKVRANRFTDEMISRMEPGQHRYFGQRPVPSSPENLVSFTQRLPHVLLILTASPSIDLKYVQVASMTDMARIACALECFRVKHGAYPEGLVELVPEFIREVPVEVVNGEPYHYRRTQDGLFLLYSVGTDLRDDGGVVNTSIKQHRQADWIWSYPSKPPAAP